MIPRTEFDLGGSAALVDYKSAFEFIEANFNEDDILICTAPTPANFYFRTCNYWIEYRLSNTLENPFINNGTNTEVYTGAEVIRTREELFSVKQPGKSLWIVSDTLTARLTSPSIRSFLFDSEGLVWRSPDETTFVKSL